MNKSRAVLHKRQTGMSLIELMIGLVVGLIILFGIIQTMMVSKSASQTQSSMSAISENARFAFEFMSRDLRMAGFNWSETGQDFQVLDNDGNEVLDEDDTPVVELNVTYIKYESGPVLTAYFNDGVKDIRARYSFSGDQLKYLRTGVTGPAEDVVLIDGITSMDVKFGVWSYSANPSDGTIQYKDYGDIGTMDDKNMVVAVRVTLGFGDPTDDGPGLSLGSNEISSTITLRNPALLARKAIREES